VFTDPAGGGATALLVDGSGVPEGVSAGRVVPTLTGPAGAGVADRDAGVLAELEDGPDFAISPWLEPAFWLTSMKMAVATTATAPPMPTQRIAAARRGWARFLPHRFHDGGPGSAPHMRLTCSHS
jgi:hypothetical protein